MRKLLTQKEAAAWIGVHLTTLRRWRKSGEGPAFIVIRDRDHKIIRYREDDLDEWADALKGQPEGG